MEDERMRAPEKLRDDDDHKPHRAWESENLIQKVQEARRRIAAGDPEWT